MSEELHQRGLTERGMAVGQYEFYNIGATSIAALKKFKIIRNRDYGAAAAGKPDGVMVDRRDKKNISVLFVAEVKSPSEFDTPEKKREAIRQCVEDYCKPLGAKLALVTDTHEYLWVNPQAPVDKDWPLILREDGYPLHTPFLWSQQTDAEQLLPLLNRLLNDITPTNSQLVREAVQNPSRLADRVWQMIWLASGEDPDACLATFVETFVFKYLSDLGILTKDESGIPVSFDATVDKDRDKCLAFYFKAVRPHIRRMFPPNPADDTSIINGTVLDPKVEEHNFLFNRILREFQAFGPLNRIDPEFKSRLYENFLKRSISQKNWGQFFTPRNIVKAMVEMSQMELLPNGAKVHDPACGVGGFILEPMLNKRARDYGVSRGRLTCKLRYTGSDRDPKTVILGKANMLIHLNELMGLNEVQPTEFARVFNETFRSTHASILGSLAQTERDEYDLILTNPPFVVTGTSKFKEFIEDNGALNTYYSVRATGVEGLFLEKIVRSVRRGGKALVIVPDGVLNRGVDKKLRKFIRDECVLDAVVSLPAGAFYTTDKKTYILVLTKKHDTAVPQTDPVFSYVVTQTGETLDANRFECLNDLPEMVRQFKYFMADKGSFQSSSTKCKAWPVGRFAPESHWSVDRWWSTAERVALGIIESPPVVTVREFAQRLDDERKEIDAAKQRLLALKSQMPALGEMAEIRLGDPEFYELFIGERRLRSLYHGRGKGPIPVWSADMDEPFAWGDDSNIATFDSDFVLWGIDSNLFKFRVIRRGSPFRTTDHCGCVRVLDPNIDASYLRHRLVAFAVSSTLDRELRPNLTTMRQVSIRFPVVVAKNGTPRTRPATGMTLVEPVPLLDLSVQKQIAAFYDTFDAVKQELATRMKRLAELELEPLTS